MRRKKRAEGEPIDPAVQAAHVNRRGAVAVGVIAAVATLAAAVITAYSTGRKQGADASPPSTVTVVQTVAGPASGTDTKSASVPTTSGIVRAGNGVPRQIQIDTGMGVDLDVADPRPVEASGPNGDLDLYFGKDMLSASQSSLIFYGGTQYDAETECPKLLESTTGHPSTPSAVGGQYCYRTSKGTVGWISVNSVDFDSGPPINHVVLNYKLFT
ncbi:hypothetical protein [Saccharothrix sp.]|uniref:hypothetical protein n=1 Tax=Saccharothrix sp. TaxID=1873460 RepID=UPI0028113ED3|nr:hypothetical protein [Saccharothrix sp.]